MFSSTNTSINILIAQPVMNAIVGYSAYLCLGGNTQMSIATWQIQPCVNVESRQSAFNALRQKPTRKSRCGQMHTDICQCPRTHGRITSDKHRHFVGVLTAFYTRITVVKLSVTLACSVAQIFGSFDTSEKSCYNLFFFT